MEQQELQGKIHPPAMVAEVLEFLRCRNLADENSNLYNPDAVFIDGTLGTAGHTIEILKAHPTCRVVGFDRDADSQKIALQRIREAGFEGRVTLVNGDFRRAPELLQPFFENLKVGADGRPISRIDGALVDAGMSLYQVSWAQRGLSFGKDGPLDMRYDRTQGPTAADLVNRLPQNELEDLLFQLADERWARRIAQFIADQRQTPITTTLELAKIVESAIPAGVRHQSKVHPSTKTFAALRLAVNDEFWALDDGSIALSRVLAPTARLVVLTYSSNEDRTVKRTFRRLAGRAQENASDSVRQARPRNRDKSRPTKLKNSSSAARSSLASLFPTEENSTKNPGVLPFNMAQNSENMGSSVHPHAGNGESATDFAENFPLMKIITPKPVVPTSHEIDLNPLSRSCKLRALEKPES